MEPSITPTPVPAGAGSKSFLARVAGVFLSPGSTFADVVRKPDFIVPLIVAMLSGLVVAETMLAKIGMERIVRQQIEHSSRASSMSPEQMQQAVEQGARIGAIMAHASFIFVPIGILIIAATGLGIGNGVFGGQISFKTAFSVACYANLVGILGTLMAVPIILFGDPEHLNPQNPLPTNLGFLLNPTDTPKPLMSLAGSFDVLTLWMMALLGTGFAEAIGPKAKNLTVFFCFFGLWALWVLAKMGLAMLG